MISLTGKVAIITGGASGIGLKYAKELLRNGLRGVTMADINKEFGENALKQLNDEFGKNKALYLNVDVTDKVQYEDAFKKTIEKFNNLDILFNNAGIFNEHTWEKEISVNLNGTINGTLLGIQTYIPKYKSGPEGVIVNMSSIAGVDPMPMIPIYAATKHAVVGFSRSFGSKMHYKLSKVRVITICPGFTDTSLVDNAEDKSLRPEYAESYKKFKLQSVLQSSDYLAKNVVNLVKDAPNGSVWVIEDNEPPYQLKLLPRNERRMT